MASQNHIQERITRLEKYVTDLKSRKTNIPSKHKGNEENYFSWVDREIRKAQTVIDNLRK